MRSKERVMLRFSAITLVAFMFSVAAVLAATPSKTVVVLFDVSGSTQNPVIRGQYQKDFEKIAKSLNPGDAIAADRIAESSAAGSTLPINSELEGGWGKNQIRMKKANRDAQKKIMEEADIVLKSPQKVKYTDIISSLQIAERVFKTYNRERNVLVIMSDMVEDSKSYNFEKDKLTDKRIADIISKEKKAGRLPDLKNVQVYAVKNATSQAGVAHAEIQAFWLSFLKETGARIDKAHYGPLTKFE